MRKILIGVILFTVCLSACKTPKKTIVETHTEYVEVLKDTTIFLPADSSSIRALLQCDRKLESCV